MEQLKAGDRTARCGVLLRDWLQRWLENELLGSVKESSYQTYLCQINVRLLPALGYLPLSEVTPAVVHGIVTQMEAAEQRALSRSEQERLRSAATQQNDLPALLSLYTGMRLGEVCALKWSDIDWEKKTVTVRRTAQRTASVENRDGKRTLLIIGSPKSRRSHRVLPIPEFVLTLRCDIYNFISCVLYSHCYSPSECLPFAIIKMRFGNCTTKAKGVSLSFSPFKLICIPHLAQGFRHTKKQRRTTAPRRFVD